MIFTYFGHSCFQIEVAGKKLLFDPYISPNTKASQINIRDINPDVILISHAHFDHIADAVDIAKQSGALVISNFEIINWLKKQEIKNTHPFNIGGNKRYDWGNVKMVNALHSSSLPDGSYGGIAGGFIIETEEGNFYYAGDTALSVEFQLIGDWYELNFAILPIGDNYTMGSEDAIVCSDMIDCDKIIGVHFNTFPEITIDLEEVKNQFSEEDKELILLNIGESIEL
jgi:L-ascorbate metabolism protein UlaG (beta-lactamase superfamily)